MTSYLYYPESAAPLERVIPLICPLRADSRAFSGRLLSINTHIPGPAAVCTTRTPILIPDQSAAFLNLAPLMACTPQQHAVLATLSKALGGGVVAGLAEFLWDTKLMAAAQHLFVYGGRGLATNESLGNGMLQALDQYDRALTHYDGLLTQGAPILLLNAAGKRVVSAIDKVNTLANLKSQRVYKKFTALLRRSPQPSVSAASVGIPLLENRQLQNLVVMAKGIAVVSNGVINLGGDLTSSGLSCTTEAVLNDIQSDVAKNTSLPSDGASAKTLLALSACGLVLGVVGPGAHAQQLQRLQHRFD